VTVMHEESAFMLGRNKKNKTNGLKQCLHDNGDRPTQISFNPL